MTSPNGSMAPGGGGPRLPLWFWGGLAAGLAVLFLIAGLVAAGILGPRASQSRSIPTPTALRPPATVKVAILPSPTELPLLPTPTELKPPTLTATSQPPQPSVSPSPAHAVVATQTPPAAPSRTVTRAATPTSLPTAVPTQLPAPARSATPTPTRASLSATLVVPAPATTRPAQPLPSPVPLSLPSAAPTGTTAPSATAAPSFTPSPAPTATPPITLATPPTKVPAGLIPSAAILQLLSVAANSQDAHAITATIAFVTDTATSPATAVIALGSSGLPNVPISVPVRFLVRPADPQAPGVTVAWQLTAPAGSRAQLTGGSQPLNSLVPDLPGYYKIDAQLLNAQNQAGALGSVRLYAGTYAGVVGGNCGTCHPGQTQAWAKTGHAHIFADELDNKRTPNVPSRYAETCIGCHTTGYYPPPYSSSGGFVDAMLKTKWRFPTFREIDAAAATGKSTWAKVPEEAKNLSNVQCEACHGPAQDHVAKGASVMPASQDRGICYQCHNGGGKYQTGTELDNAAHADATARAWTEPTGPGEQACVRCHSGYGYASFLADPGNMASWDNRPQPVVCATCHDPHGSPNGWQLRIAGKPVGLPFEVKPGVGLSATCYECHNARTSAADAATGQASFPHYSSAAEFLSDTGGVTYDKTIPNSPHGMVVGTQPVPNPDAAKDPANPKFLWSKPGDEGGNSPGPCVACHMWPAINDAQDPNYKKLGGHSFNLVSPDGKAVYAAACQSCHAGVTDFNLKAKADYDGNGQVEGVQTEIKGLLDRLWLALEAAGVKQVADGYPYATLPMLSEGKPDPKISNAWYNFRSVYGVMWGKATGAGNQGKAQAIHNFQRAAALLQASYRDLTGEDIPNAALLYR